MPGIFIIAHAPLATALKAVATHTFPDCVGLVEALDVDPHTPLEQVEAQARASLEKVMQPDALILTDVFGATPCNIAHRLVQAASPGQVRLIAGVNVPMLWRALCYGDEPLESVSLRALAGATQGIMHVSIPKPLNQVTFLSDHDQKNPKHHQ